MLHRADKSSQPGGVEFNDLFLPSSKILIYGVIKSTRKFFRSLAFQIKQDEPVQTSLRWQDFRRQMSNLDNHSNWEINEFANYVQMMNPHHISHLHKLHKLFQECNRPLRNLQLASDT